MFDVTVCQFDSPIIVSWPHFLGAEDKFRDAVTGMNPVKVISKPRNQSHFLLLT